jgi:hypothetical protein
MASQGNLYPPDFSGSNPASERKAPSYVKGFYSLGKDSLIMRDPGVTINENKYFEKTYGTHTLANNYEYMKYYKGYTEGFFVDLAGGLAQGKGYLKNSIYPVALYCLPSNDTTTDNYNDYLKAMKEKIGVTNNPDRPPIYYPDWLSQIYDNINIYSDTNIYTSEFIKSYNDYAVDLSENGYRFVENDDYFKNQGIGSRVPLVNVPIYAYTDSSGQVFRVKVNTSFNQVDRSYPYFDDGKNDKSLTNNQLKKKYSLDNVVVSNNLIPLGYNLINQRNGHLELSGNLLKYETGNVENVVRFIDTNYHNFNPINQTGGDLDYNYSYNNKSYKMQVQAKILPFNLLINNSKQIDTIKFYNSTIPISNTELVHFNSVQKSKYYYSQDMSGTQNFPLDLYQINGDKTYVTLKDRPLIPNNLIQNAIHSLTTINDEIYMYVLVTQHNLENSKLVLSRESIYENDTLKSNGEITDIIKNYIIDNDDNDDDFMAYLFYVGDDNKKEQNIGKLIKTPIEISLVSKPNGHNPLDVITGGTSIKITSVNYTNSLGWDKNSWNWNDTTNIDTTNPVPHTNTDIRDLSLQNVAKESTDAVLTNYGELLFPDTFSNLLGLYYHKDDNVESFIYISSNLTDGNQHNVNVFFRKASDFTDLMPSTAGNKFKTDISGTLFNSSSGAYMDITNIDSKIKSAITPDVLGSSSSTLNSNSEIYISFLNNLSIINIGSIGIEEDNIFTGVPPDSINKIAPDMVVTYSNNEMITKVGSAKNNKLTLPGVGHSNIAIGMNVYGSNVHQNTIIESILNNGGNTEITLSKNMINEVENKSFSFITIVDSLVTDISGQKLSIESDIHTSSSKNFVVTNQRYLYYLDDSHFGITEYNDYLNIPAGNDWKIKFYAQNNLEVNVVDLFGNDTTFAAVSSNDWTANGRPLNNPSIEQQTRGIIVSADNSGTEGIGCWYIENTNCAATDRLFTDIDGVGGARIFADTYFDGLATQDDLKNLPSTNFLYGDSWGNGFNPGRHNYGFKGSNGSWYWAYNSIPSEGIRAIVKLKDNQLPNSPENVLGHIIKVNLYRGNTIMMSGPNGSSFKGGNVVDKPPPQFTMYYKKTTSNSQYINNEVWFKSTINQSLLLPPSFEETLHYNYNYDSVDNNPHLNNFYYTDITYDRPIIGANYETYTPPSVILDGNINTHIYLVRNIGDTYPEIHNITLTLHNNIQVNKLEVYYKNLGGNTRKPYQIELITSYGEIKKSFNLQQNATFNWEDFKIENDLFDIKYVKISSEKYKNNDLRCYISAIKINDNMLTNRNSWLISWGDLSVTQKQGDSNFLVGENKSPDFNLDGANSIVSPRLANKQNYPLGIQVKTIPENITPNTVYNPNNVPLPYIGKDLLYGEEFISDTNRYNLTNLPSNKYIQFRFIFPRRITMESFSFAFYNYHHSYSGFNLLAIDPTDNTTKTLLSSHYLYTGGNWFGIKGVPDTNGILPGINSDSTNYIYRGSHQDITDSDMVIIPNNLRISAKEYRLGIYLNSDPKVYIYYVRFKGQMSKPNINTISSLKSFNFRLPQTYYYKRDQKIIDGNDTLQSTSEYTTDNIIDSKRMKDDSGNVGFINIGTDARGIVSFITPFFTKNTYYKIVNNVGAITLNLDDTDKAIWSKQITSDSKISLFDSSNIKITELSDVDLFNVDIGNNNITANGFKKNTGLFSLDVAESLNYIKNMNNIKIVGSTVTEHYSETLQINLLNNDVISGDNLTINRLYNDVSGSIDKIVYNNKKIIYTHATKSFDIIEDRFDYDIPLFLNSIKDAVMSYAETKYSLSKSSINGFNDTGFPGTKWYYIKGNNKEFKNISGTTSDFTLTLTDDNPGTIVVGMLVFGKYIQSNTIITQIDKGDSKKLTLSRKALKNVLDNSIIFETTHNDFDKIPYNSTITIDNLVKFVIQQNSPKQNLDNPVISNVVVKNNFSDNTSKGIGGKYVLSLSQFQSTHALGTSYHDNIKILEKGNFYETGENINIRLRENKIARFFIIPPFSIYSFIKSFKKQNIDNAEYTDMMPYINIENQFSPLYILKTNEERFFTSLINIDMGDVTLIQKLRNIHLCTVTLFTALFKRSNYGMSSSVFKPPLYHDFCYVDSSGNIPPEPISNLPINFEYFPELILKNTSSSGNVLHIRAFSEINIRTYLADESVSQLGIDYVDNDTIDTYDSLIVNDTNKMDSSNIIAYDFMMYTTTNLANTTSDSTSVLLEYSNSIIKIGQRVIGNGIAEDTIVSAVSEKTLTLSKNATISNTNTQLTFISENDIKNYSINGDAIFGNIPKITDIQLNGGINMKSKHTLEIPSIKNSHLNTIRNFTIVIWVDLEINYDHIIPNSNDEIKIFNFPTNSDTNERLYLSILNIEGHKNISYGYANNKEQGATFNLPNEGSQRHCFICSYNAITKDVDNGGVHDTQLLQSDISLFFDGTEQITAQERGGEVCQINHDSNGILELGSPSIDNGFISGKILTFQMYNRILSSSEKKALYNMGTLPSFRMGYILEKKKYLSFFRKLNIDPSYLNKDTYQNMTNESYFSGIIQPIKNCNNKFCRSDFSGNYIYEGYFNKSYLTTEGLKGIPIQFPIVSCGGKLPNYYPEGQINTILDEFAFTTSGDLGSLNENECGFYKMYYKFLSSHKTPTDDPSLLPEDSSMHPCDILGNTLGSSNFTFRIRKFLDEISNASIPNNKEEADYSILLNTIINLLGKNKVYEYSESTLKLPRITTLMKAYLDNLKTAISYQLLYIKIINVLPTDDDLELFDDVINNIRYAIDTHSYYISNNKYIESKWESDFSGVQNTIFETFENIPTNGNWNLIKTPIKTSINNKLYTPNVVVSYLQTWLSGNFNTIMFDTTSNFVTDVIDELYYFSIGNTLDLSGYPILFRKEKRNIIKLIKTKNEKVITLNDVSGINIGMRFIPAKYSTDNNLTTSNYFFSDYYVTSINQNNIHLSKDIQDNSDIVTDNFYNTHGNKYEYQPASFLPNTLVSVAADVIGSKNVNYPTVIKVGEGITVNNNELTIDLTVSPQANLITKGQRVTGLSISDNELVFIITIVKDSDTITINLNKNIDDGDQFIFSDREPLLFNREDYRTNENTIKIIVKGSKATTDNTTSTLDNIKLGMCMFKSSLPTIIENTNLKVGKPINYSNPIPIISFSKIAVNNNSFTQGSISSDKTQITFNHEIPIDVSGFHIRGEGINLETTVTEVLADGKGKTNIKLSNKANISTTDKTYYFSDLSYGIVEIEKQFGNKISILNTQHFVFEYYDYYYLDNYQLFPPGTSVQLNEDMNNNITLSPPQLSGIINGVSTIGNFIPEKYGKNKFTADVSSPKKISGNYLNTNIKKYTVNVVANKFEIKDDQTSETFNNLFIEGNIYEFDITALGTSHSFSFSLTQDGIHGGGVELVDPHGIIRNEDYIKVFPDKLYVAYVYYYCSKHPNYGDKIDINTGTSEIYYENPVVYPTNNLQKRYNVTRFGPQEVNKNKICYLNKTLLTTPGQKYVFKCDIWLEQLSSHSSNIKNGSVFIYDGDIKLIKSDTTGISVGNTQTKVNKNNKFEVLDNNRWFSISADIVPTDNLVSIVFVSYNNRIAIDNDSVSFVTEDYIPPTPNYGNTIHTLDFKEVVDVEIEENITSSFVSNLEIGQTGGMISNNSTLYLDGDIAYQNFKTNDIETGGTIFIDLSPFPGRLGDENISSGTDESGSIGCKLNFENNLLQFTQYLSKQLNDKSINKIEYDVTYDNSTGYFQIKHYGNKSISKTSFYVRKNYSYNSISKKNEVIYERVYRTVKTYFDFSKLTSVGGILGFMSNDTQFCYKDKAITSCVSMLDSSSQNYRRINLLRYISTTYGMEYTIGMHIDVNGNESNRPLDNSENSRSDSASNHKGVEIEAYINQGVSEISTENLSIGKEIFTASELLEKKLIDFNKEENKKIKVGVESTPNKYWLRDVSGNWTSHFDN